GPSVSPTPGIAVTFLEQDRQRPEQIAALLAEFLSAAGSSLHIAIYDLRLGDAVAAPVVEALRQRAAAGVDVRIAYDAGKPQADFAERWQSGDIGTSGARDTGTVRVGTAPVHVAFAPGQGRAIDHDVAHRIAAARRRLKVCSMLITSGAILGALSDALQRGRL